MRTFPPPYIVDPVQTSPVIRYRWDDWDDEERPVDDAFNGRLEHLSFRALAAFTVAIAEWIVYRFSGLSDDPLPEQYIEAAWLQVIDWDYGHGWDELQDMDQWTGPVRAPMWDALQGIQYVIRVVSEFDDASLMCAWNDGLATLVLPEPAAYLAWRESVLSMLEKEHPRTDDDPAGDVILPELFAPGASLSDTEIERLANERLQRARLSGNPFLKTSEELLDEGFEGKPYVFNLSADRERRLNW